MMEDDPAERFKMIRDAIEASGTAVEDMTRKQKMFISNAAGFESVSDFTKAMSGDLSALQKEMGDADSIARSMIQSRGACRRRTFSYIPTILSATTR